MGKPAQDKREHHSTCWDQSTPISPAFEPLWRKRIYSRQQPHPIHFFCFLFRERLTECAITRFITYGREQSRGLLIVAVAVDQLLIESHRSGTMSCHGEAEPAADGNQAAACREAFNSSHLAVWQITCCFSVSAEHQDACPEVVSDQWCVHGKQASKQANRPTSASKQANRPTS